MKNRSKSVSGWAVFNSATNKQISKTFKYKSRDFYKATVTVRRAVRSGMAQLEIRRVELNFVA